MGWAHLDGKCYWYESADQLSYREAGAHCRMLALGLNGGLANARTPDEFALLDRIQRASRLKLHTAWVGARATHSEVRGYHWDSGDGAPLDNADGRWAVGEPNAKEPQCVAITTRGGQRGDTEPMQLNDADCLSHRRVFCAADLPTTTSTTASTTTTVSATSVTSATTATATSTTATATSTTVTATSATATSTTVTATSVSTTSVSTRTEPAWECDAYSLDGWERFDNRCIRFYTDKKAFQNAERHCAVIVPGGHLSSIRTPGEGAFLKDMMSNAG